MSFIKNAEKIARTVMFTVDPTLADAYASLIAFLSIFPEAASKTRGNSAPEIGSRAYLERQAEVFASSRKPRSPKAPATIPDEMVSVILNEYFGIPVSDLDRLKREHLLSMGAENFVGDLLERYLASIMEPEGWVWCSGAMVRSVDFVKPPKTPKEPWRLLQVKNRDNSENSSSSAIRDGTNIEKWHRTFSKKVGSNWAEFPDKNLRRYLSENAFESYVREYLRSLRT